MKSYAAIVIFFAKDAVYYGSSFAMALAGLDIYTNIALMTSAETIAHAITSTILLKLFIKFFFKV